MSRVHSGILPLFVPSAQSHSDRWNTKLPLRTLNLLTVITKNLVINQAEKIRTFGWIWNEETLLILYFKAGLWLIKCKVSAAHGHILNVSVGGKIGPASQSQWPHSSWEKCPVVSGGFTENVIEKRTKLFLIKSEHWEVLQRYKVAFYKRQCHHILGEPLPV